MSFQMKNKPLVGRVYRIKNPTMEFYCPLCRTERAFKCQPRLSPINYIQIIFITALVVIIAYPLAGLKSLPIFFILWAGFEMIQRLRFKKEIPCPHCGFDATWYHRDVRVAREKVKEFWAQKNSMDQAPSSELSDEDPDINLTPDDVILGEQPLPDDLSESSASL
jgi:hypothetical protein